MSDNLVLFEKSLPSGKFIVYSAKPQMSLKTVKQTHSDIVLFEENCQGHEADGIIGSNSTPKAILTADCLPIVLLGKEGHAVVHAGWRGLKQAILLNKEIVKLDPYYAFIGPHISVAHYEVQPEFFSEFNNEFYYEKRNEKLYFNLSKVARAQLSSSFNSIKIEESEICTFSNSNFHSFRRDKTPNRNWNVYFP
jgi:YfiH family protein